MKMSSGAVPPDLTKYSDLLLKVPLFKGVSSDTIQDLLSRCDERTYDAGEILLRPDTLNEQMYLILTGSVSIHLDSLDRAPLTTLGAGECVGEMSLFDGKPPSAWVKVLEPGTMLIVRRRVLWDMVDASHGIARNLLYTLSQRIRATNLAMTEIQEQKRRHERAASLDELTGLHNRGWLERLLSRIEGDRLIPYLPLSVVMLDLDQFKRLNDACGHPAGDAALQSLGALLQQNVRPLDMVARYGGEEFIILLPNTPRAGALVMAERLRQKVSDSGVRFAGEELPKITISAGVAVCATVRPVEEVIREADAALYRAKHAGRNCVSD